MVKLALFGQTYPSQLQANPRALQGLEVVWAGASLESLRTDVPKLRPEVLALDFVDLGKVPEQLVPELLEATGARHALVSYRLTHHAMLQAITSERIRFIQGPLPLTLLRTHVERALENTSRVAPRPPPRPPRFTAEQLGRLMEIASSVKCECPNQLAQLVSGLQAFEQYSKTCESQNEKDQRIHALLYRQSAVAREALEEGLVALLEHENIQL
ncbi:hypothetical protein [Archangium sp.]|uniref:hypothetical protein n=1 Tax=Archangium sp. TaxID=1872627 RepID=UPI00286C9D92|nr:hypothetical protein [Archangium sp.]